VAGVFPDTGRIQRPDFEPVLRYVVSGLAGTKDGIPDIAQFPENAARVETFHKTLPAVWGAMKGHPGLTREVQAAIRVCVSAVRWPTNDGSKNRSTSRR
jgi:hypothetical protein